MIYALKAKCDSMYFYYMLDGDGFNLSSYPPVGVFTKRSSQNLMPKTNVAGALCDPCDLLVGSDEIAGNQRI